MYYNFYISNNGIQQYNEDSLQITAYMYFVTGTCYMYVHVTA